MNYKKQDASLTKISIYTLLMQETNAPREKYFTLSEKLVNVLDLVRVTRCKDCLNCTTMPGDHPYCLLHDRYLEDLDDFCSGGLKR